MIKLLDRLLNICLQTAFKNILLNNDWREYFIPEWLFSYTKFACFPRDVLQSVSLL